MTDGGGTIVVEVPVPGAAYPVVVGPGARAGLADLLDPRARRVAVVTQTGIDLDVEVGREHRVFLVGDGERAKSLATVEELCRAWSRWGLTRTDQVVAVGGGVVTDTAGFAAAVYHRGVAVVHVPTTLLGMVDAAIGGKTGVNLVEGKNLVGAFWQPTAVVCDTDALATLPEREQRSGRGEMAKYHFLTGDDLLALPLTERIAACVRIKAAVVAADEHEDPAARTGRATLNYGHTLAHALENAGGYDLRHGEAVAVGLAYAAALARRLGRIDDARVAHHHEVLAAYGLDPAMPAGADPEALVRLMARDKKAVGGGLTFVLDGPDGVEVVPGVEEAEALAALAGLAGGAGVSGRPIVLLLNGPNLNLLGSREPEIYGAETLADHVDAARDAAQAAGLDLEHAQSNHEGDLVDAVQAARGRCAAIVINPGAFTHYAWALHDALAAFDGPVVEVHLSNPQRREAWRHTSVVAPVATGTIAGLGVHGYRLAIEAVSALLGTA